MTFTVTINGIAKEIRAGSLQMSKTMNGRSTVQFSVMSHDRSYRPPFDGTVIIERDGVREFGGLIHTPREKGLFPGVKPSIETVISATDFHSYADRRLVKESIPAGSLKAALDVLIGYLTGYGVTLSATQVTGPSLPALEYDYRPLSEVLNNISTITADLGEQFVWKIDYFKVLSMYQPTTVLAPFDLIADLTGAVPQVVGDIQVEKDGSSYANRIIVLGVAKEERDRRESFTGDGASTSFQLQYTLTGDYGHILVGSGGGETFAIEGTLDDNGNPVQWWYNTTDGVTTITRNIGPTASGETYTLQFHGTYAPVTQVEDAGEIAIRGLVEKRFDIPDIPEDTTIEAIAAGLLAQSLPIHEIITYATRENGLQPGQTQTIIVPPRNLDGDMIITDVVTREFGPSGLIHQIKAVFEGDTNVLKDWRDVYKAMLRDLTGGKAAETGAAPISMGPAPPFESNQFNDSGRFGGHSEWLFRKGHTTVQLGTGHTSGGSRNMLIGENHTVN